MYRTPATQIEQQETPDDFQIYQKWKARLAKNGLDLANAPYEFRSNGRIVEVAVKENGLALQFADNTIKKTQNIVAVAIEQNPDALEFADPKIQDDYPFLKPYLAKYPQILIFTSKTVRDSWIVLHPEFINTVPGLQAKIAEEVHKAAYRILS